MLDAKSISAVKDRAERFLLKGRLEEALSLYEGLSPYAAKDPRILIRTGDIARKLGDDGKAIGAYREAAACLAKTGFVVKAIGVCKILQQIDPDGAVFEKELMGLYSEKKDEAEREERKGTEKKRRPFPKAPLFSDLRSDELLDVVKRTRFLELKAGDTLFKEGDEGDSIFIIVSGELDIVSTVGEKEVPLARLKAVSGRNDFFGEFGFFSNSRRKATVRGSTDAELLEIKKSGMLEISAKYPAVGRVLFEFYKTRVVDRIMAISKIFGTLSKDERTEVLKRLTPKVFRGGSLAVREGAQGDTMYLIKEGRAEVWTSGPSGGVKTLSTLGPGEFFGEVALATARPRVASVRAITTLHTVEFSRELVKDILAAHPEIKTALEEVIKERIADLVMVRKGRLL